MSVVIVPVFLGTAFTSNTEAFASSKSPIEISPIRGEFSQHFFRTEYTTLVTIAPSLRAKAVSITWSLKLELVDKAGAPDPEMTAIGMASGAAVDPGCNNHGIMESSYNIPMSRYEYYRTGGKEFFDWHHPDAANSIPKGFYHCDHELQGPHGHQGLITIVVSDGTWKCVATFKGTHSSLATTPGKPNPNVKNGTASEPTCSKI